MGKHLTYESRLTIDRMLKKGYSVREIADAIGCCRATVYNETKRSTYMHTVRRFYPKGKKIKTTRGDVKKVQTWMNGYPRRMFGGESAQDRFNREMMAMT